VLFQVMVANLVVLKLQTMQIPGEGPLGEKLRQEDINPNLKQQVSRSKTFPLRNNLIMLAMEDKAFSTVDHHELSPIVEESFNADDSILSFENFLQDDEEYANEKFDSFHETDADNPSDEDLESDDGHIRKQARLLLKERNVIPEKKRRGRKPKHSVNLTPSVKPSMSNTGGYDSRTCGISISSLPFPSVTSNVFLAFDILAVVNSSQGDSNRPFKVPFPIKFEDLLILVAEKLRCFPGLLKLCYRLDIDRQTAVATSIQSNEEFMIFIERMRQLIVPQRLPSGKISSCALKPVMVCFEDEASSDSSGQNSARTSRNGMNRVCSICFF
jgi:hypothetical protein